MTLKDPVAHEVLPQRFTRPIAFLNTIGKVMESIMGKQITYLVETHRLLPEI